MDKRSENSLRFILSGKWLVLRRLTMVCGITVLLCIPFRQAFADIYQYTDENGIIHFSNVGVGNAKKYRKVKTESKRVTRPEDVRRSDSRPTESARSSSKENTPDSSYTEIINSACYRHGVDPALVHAMVKVESDFNPYALSSRGAMGLMQLMPQTAVDLKVRNIFSPDENIDGGVKYLRYLLDRYEGNLSLALAAYNSGETAVQKWGTVPPFRETQDYVQRVLKIYDGTGRPAGPRYTIYIGYDEDGALLLTDDPSKKNIGRKVNRRTDKSL
ncbi:MAG TPA: lytic transglycosylase domain-containing protein [Nitrospirota bacterium]|nr:lytic transglycosylase domain-containing protein [Nitrospirota bacterium]